MDPSPDVPESYLYERPALTARGRLLVWLLTPPLIAACCAAALTGRLDSLERLSIDARFRSRGPLVPDPRIVVVEIDEQSRRTLAGPQVRFDLRAHLDDAIEQLADAGAVCIGLDVWLQGRGDSATDARLAEVMAQTNVVLGVAYTHGMPVRAAEPFLQTDSLEGTVAVQPDPDGVLRRLPDRAFLDLVDGDGVSLQRVPHFPFVLAYFALSEEQLQAGGQPLPADFQAPDRALIAGRVVPYGRLINFAAGPGQGFRTLDFADIARARFDPELVDGAVVLIGDVRSVVDQFRIPLSEKLCPGVYYHANVVDQILGDRPLVQRPAGRRAGALLVFGIATVAGWYFWNLRDWWALRAGWLLMMCYFAGGVALFWGGWWLLCQRTFNAGTVLPLVAPLVAVGVVLLSALAWQLVVSTVNARRLARRSRQIESLFGRAVSPQVLEAIKQDPGRIARTEVREVSVLFCDIRGFTAASAELPPEQVAAMLNEYFESVTSAVFEQDGFVDKFVGDELMAVFSVPLEQPDHALRAARSAQAIKRRLAGLNDKRVARGQSPLDCGVGIHCGPAAVGHIGTARRANYTVVGDTVNLAARIEELTTGGEMLVSEEFGRRLDDSLAIRPWRTVELRGSGRALRLFELLAE